VGPVPEPHRDTGPTRGVSIIFRLWPEGQSKARVQGYPFTDGRQAFSHYVPVCEPRPSNPFLLRGRKYWKGRPCLDGAMRNPRNRRASPPQRGPVPAAPNRVPQAFVEAPGAAPLLTAGGTVRDACAGVLAGVAAPSVAGFPTTDKARLSI
jgi:hypothetical protein